MDSRPCQRLKIIFTFFPLLPMNNSHLVLLDLARHTRFTTYIMCSMCINEAFEILNLFLHDDHKKGEKGSFKATIFSISAWECSSKF